MLKKTFPNPTSLLLEINTPSSGLLEKKYRELVEQQHIQYDDAQSVVLQQLQLLLDKLSQNLAYEQKTRMEKLFSNPPEKGQSIYIFGDVGRGKSMLMSLFFEACPFTTKRRVHFNTFMQEVHAFIHQNYEQQGDSIATLAKNIKESVTVLCFDEFHVTDIADAMIIGRLFSKLFELGIIIVITSNRHPNDLYQGGLQRENFLFFVKTLNNWTQVIELRAKIDYRLNHQSQRNNYYFPLDCHETEFIKTRFTELTESTIMKAGVLHVSGRKIVLSAVHQDVALSSFEALCEQPLGAADYLAIAKNFNTLIFSGIPRLSSEKRNEAKRLMILIDILYEHKIRLICSADTAAHEIYVEGDGVFEFKRTVSRLIEMQSHSYFQRNTSN